MIMCCWMSTTALETQIALLGRLGHPPQCHFLADPASVGKTQEHNLELLARLSLFHSLGTPICWGFIRANGFIRYDPAMPPAVRRDRAPRIIAVALAGI